MKTFSKNKLKNKKEGVEHVILINFRQKRFAKKSKNRNLQKSKWLDVEIRSSTNLAEEFMCLDEELVFM